MALIPTENLEALQNKVDIINRKATKNGLPVAFSFVVTGTTTMVEFGEKPHTYFVEYSEVLLQGAHAKFDGWRLISNIELDPIIGNIIKTVPGETLPTEYFNTTNKCGHCNSIRKRNNVFVLQHDDGTYIVVGRQCLADFLGGVSAEHLLAINEFVNRVTELAEDREYVGGLSVRHHSLVTVLAYTNAVMTKFGWCSATTAAEHELASTRNRVCFNMFDNKRYDFPKDCVDPTDVDYEIANSVIEYFKEFTEANATNDYIYNCSQFARAGAVNQKGFGIVCSMVNAYKKNLDFAKKSVPESEWIGSVGDKIQVELTFKSFFEYTGGQYGSVYFMKFEDANGNKLIWKASNPPKLEPETIYVVKGTVKTHDMYKTTKQTNLTRCKIVS